MGERTTRIQTPDETIVRILSKGTQFVLRSSIHPDNCFAMALLCKERLP